MIPRIDLTNAGATAYLIDTRYNTKTGWAQMAAAGPDGTPARFVKLHAATGTKTVSWTCEALDAFPVCPHWDTQSDNEVLLEKEITPCAPAPGLGGRVWRVSGLYKYGLKLPPGDSDSLVTGVVPGSGDVVNGCYLPMTVFLKNVIGPAPAMSNSGGGGVTGYAVQG
jgi:hypothetical protein